MYEEEIKLYGLEVSCLYEDVIRYIPIEDRPDPLDDSLRRDTAHLFLNARGINHTEIEVRKIAVSARQQRNGKGTRR